MEKSPPQNDKCPHCRILFEIVSVKIGLARVTMQSILSALRLGAG
jgi:hypothetical protein